MVASDHVFWCNQQGSYQHGAQMCTTACMQVGMATLCGQLDPEAACRAAGRGDDAVCTAFVGTLNWCMNAGSIVHGRVEGILGRRDSGGGFFGQQHRSRMISVNELITVLGIDLPALGVGVEELVVCNKGLDTRMLIKEEEEEGERDEGISPKKYEPESCFIGLAHLPMCMLTRGGQNKKKGRSVALVTANGHTVCASCCGEECYSLFDPMPGQMWVGLSGAQMSSKLQRVLGMPSSVRGSPEDVRFVSAKDAVKDKKRNKMVKRFPNSGGWEDCGDGILRSGSKKIKKAQQQEQQHGDDYLGDDSFYADVTVLHVK